MKRIQEWSYDRIHKLEDDNKGRRATLDGSAIKKLRLKYRSETNAKYAEGHLNKKEEVQIWGENMLQKSR